MTQLQSALKNIITEEMKTVAFYEKKSEKEILDGVRKGEIVIPKNRNHDIKARGIGKNLSVKINANIGTSRDCQDIDYELKKLEIAEEYGADAIMDLSTGGNLDAIRKAVIEKSSIPVGTVPIYESAVITLEKFGNTDLMEADLLFEIIEKQCSQGVDFITVHCGITAAALELLNSEKRILNIVSRGGAMLAAWMKKNKKENPLYSQYDRLLEIAEKYDVTLSLGDGLRPGCLADASDRAQMHELITLGELTRRARNAGIQTMIEGPGHMPINQIEMNMKLQKRICDNAPFYVLGPLVTDIAPGYDHITSAIGGALAAYSGADFLCYVTPAEHLRLPSVEDVKLGVIASKIAAHAADIAKGLKDARDVDDKMAAARMKLDWKTQAEYALDKKLVEDMRRKNMPEDKDVCTMCSAFCAVKKINDSQKED